MSPAKERRAMTAAVVGLLIVGCLALSILAVVSLIYDFRQKQEKSRPRAAGPFTVEHDRLLASLKSNGSAAAETLSDECILTSLVAAGFAKKQGTGYVYTGKVATATVEAPLESPVAQAQSSPSAMQPPPLPGQLTMDMGRRLG